MPLKADGKKRRRLSEFNPSAVRDTAIQLKDNPPRQVVLRELVQSLSATAADLDRALVSRKPERINEAMGNFPMLRQKLDAVDAAAVL